MISVAPTCAEVVTENAFDESLTYSLRNFTPNAEVTVVFGSDGAQQQPVVVGPFGSLDQQLTFLRGGFNSVEIRAFETANRANAASTSLVVPCAPVITVAPICDAPADPAAPRQLSVGVEGQRWDEANGRVSIVVQQGDVQVSASTQVTPDDSRHFVATINEMFQGDFEVPLSALPVGDYTVVARQDNGATATAGFAVPCPGVTLQPDCGEADPPPGTYDIVVAGSGFRPGLQAQVIFDSFGQPQVFLADIGPSGEIATVAGDEPRIKPLRRAGPASYFVTVRQGTPESLVREVTTTFAVPCPPEPEISIEPLCGPPQIVGDDPRTYDLRVTGQNLPPGTVTVVFDAESRSGPPQVIPIPVSGTLNQVVPIARRPTNTYVVTATHDGAPLAETFAFQVPCAASRARVRMRCEPENTDLPELANIVVAARGFYPDSPLELMVDGVSASAATTDSSGSYVLTLPAGDRPAGPVEVIATQSDAMGVVAQASATLVLPCGTRAPILVISPPAASSGVVVAVEGFNFRPGAQVSLRWDRGIGNSQTIDVVADADGAFSRQVLIFPHDFRGGRQLLVDSSDDQFAAGLTAEFLVLAGRGSPPAFVIDSQSPELPGQIIIRR